MIKKEKISKTIDILVIGFLGITTVLTSYASWLGGQANGRQSDAYTETMRSNTVEIGLYNKAESMINLDFQIYSEVVKLKEELNFFKQKGDSLEVKLAQDKLDSYIKINVSTKLAEAMAWAESQTEDKLPFDQPGYAESFYKDAYEQSAMGEQLIENARKANDVGDQFGLVSIIYAVTLFLLGIVSANKSLKIQIAILSGALSSFVFGSIIFILNFLSM